MEVKTICEIVRDAESNWNTGETTHSKYVSLSIKDTIDKIEAYANSKHISGETDSLGREKPFFNIVTAAENIWYRATDIDRKNIRIRATKEADTVGAFMMTLLLQKWMRKANFGVFLNKWGRTLARYGSAITKHVEKNGEFISEVIPWNRIICDAIDFDNNIKIEKFWITPAQLQKRVKENGYDEKFVKQLLDKHITTTRTLFDNQTKDNKADYLPIYEIHGELPLSLLTDNEEDDDIFARQMHVVCFLEKNDKSGYDDYTLFRGKESKDPYMITHLLEEDGQVLSIGAVQHLFEAQWMVNHSQKAIKDQLDLASKLIFQTADGNYVGRNALTNIENGDIMVYQPNMPLTQLANNSHDITSLQSFQAQWQTLGREIVNTPEAQAGIQPPSGTAWRLQETVIQQSQSLFELMTENKGLAIVDMLTNYIIPFLKKKMDTKEEISEILSNEQIDFIDKRYLPAEVTRIMNQKKKNAVLNGELLTQDELNMLEQQAQQDVQGKLDAMGKQRFISPSSVSSETWKDVFKYLEYDLEVDVTGEVKDAQSAMQTLSTVLQTIAGLNGQPMSDEIRTILNKILSLSTTLSPLELQSLNKPAVVPTPFPQVAPQPI